MRLALSEIAEMVGGQLVGDDVTVDGVTIDSREIEPGQLFVPVVAARDGHDFVSDALGRGAVAYLTNREPRGASAVVVSDTVEALTTLARGARDRIPERVVGITGSVGKTTVKDLLSAVLSTSYRTFASPRSFNNELGVPLTILSAPDEVEALVVEMGARGIDHIAHLCRIARPTVGVVTTVGLAHLELFGHLDEVVRAKGELVESLPSDGVAVLNANVPEVSSMADRTVARVLTFGFEHADVAATDVRLDSQLRPSFHLNSPWGSVGVHLEVRGEHQVANALAAAAAGLASGVRLQAVAEGLQQAEISPWRMEMSTTPSGALVLNDAYNANPASMQAALRALALLEAPRRTAVLGPMAELGEHTVSAHREVAELASELRVRLIAVGAPDYGPPAESVADVEGALELLGELDERDAVLVKGSRVAGLERLAEALVAGG